MSDVWKNQPYPGVTTTLHDVQSIRVLPARTITMTESPIISHHRTIEIVQEFNGQQVVSTFVCFANDRDNLEVQSDD